MGGKIKISKRSTKRTGKLIPKTRAGGEWTEARFFGFFRNGLRGMSRRWPPIVRQIVEKSRRRYTGPLPRIKWEYHCALCDKWFTQSSKDKSTKVCVDHIESLPPIKSIDDIPAFIRALFCEIDGLRVTCVQCNQRRAAEQHPSRRNADSEEAMEGTLFDEFEDEATDDSN